MHLTEIHQKTYSYYNRSLITVLQQAISHSQLFTPRSHRISFYSDCLLLWNVSDYLVISWCVALEQDLMLFNNCRIM